MTAANLIITPKTKVGELLDAYPQLEDILLELSPAFAKLKNPILRKTVARIATLQQAATVGGLKTDELVNRLRREAGQNERTGENGGEMYLVETEPDWFDDTKIIVRFDASPVISSGGSPLQEILSLANKLRPGEILEVTTPFIPAPVIDMLREKGFRVFSIKKENGVQSCFMK
jgi:hypothetical protein